MFGIYNAKLYLGDKVVMQTAGDSVADLYLWMLTNSEKVGGNNYSIISGEIIENHTGKVVQTFGNVEIDK